jgi:hypothetical protein
MRTGPTIVRTVGRSQFPGRHSCAVGAKHCVGSRFVRGSYDLSEGVAFQHFDRAEVHKLQPGQ